MAVKALEIHPSALLDLRSAVMWYLERSQAAAERFVDEVDHSIELIIESPNMWPAGLDGTRKFVLSRFPYAIVYREKLVSIEILAIAHGHRNPDYWKNRL
jgi:plasmid stabilization system protein ParE